MGEIAEKDEIRQITFNRTLDGAQKELEKLSRQYLRLLDKAEEAARGEGQIAAALEKTDAAREQLQAGIRELLPPAQALRQALAGLKEALVTAFAPVYQAALPALTALVRGLSGAVSAVGRFLTALLGVKRAKTGVKTLEKEAKALSGTGKAAKEAAGSLAAFDEINTLAVTDKPGSGGAGGGAGDEGAGAWEEVWEETAPIDWGLAFSRFLDEILNSGLPRLQKGLEQCAAWLNRFSAKLYGMFTFPQIREKVERIGAGLAESFDRLTAAIDWRALGAAIGAGLDLALVLAARALYGYDWQALGRGLAEGLSSLIRQADWIELGRLLWSGFKLALELLAGFLLGLDMTELAQAAGRVALGFFQALQETVAGIDWQQIGRQIRTFLVQLDWPGVARAMAEALGEAFGAAAAVLWGLLEESWQKIADWWRERACADGRFTIEGLLEGVLEGMSGIVQWLDEHVVRPFLEGFCALFGIHSPSAVMAELGSLLMAGLLGGILNGCGPVLDAVRTLFSGITAFVAGVFTGDWSRAWQGVANIFRGIWNGILSVLEGAVNLVISGVNWMIGQLNRLQINVPSWLGGGTLGFHIPPVSGVSIPRLAQGAVIPPNREFMALLGDNKRETEIVSPLSTMKQAFLEALRESGGAGGDIHITLELDGRTVARNTVRHVNDMTRAAGRPVLVL